MAGQRSFQLSTGLDSSGVQHILSEGSDITATLISGQLGGVLEARDQQIPGIQTQLDALASGLANAVNGVQTSGYALNGNPSTGDNLFSPHSAAPGPDPLPVFPWQSLIPP